VRPVYGGIEAGGTKFVCLIASGPEEILEQARIPTTSPEETLGKVIEFFRAAARQLISIGMGSFGPLDLDPGSLTFGHVTSTPKPGWSGADLVGPLRDGLGLEVVLDTDVNAAALGEFRWGASRGDDPSLYLTIGTGIGGGCIIGGRPLLGMLNPEMGHVHVPHDRALDPFPGSCPFHADCFEGLACGPAIRARLGVAGEDLRPDHPFWEIETGYIAAALTNYILTLSPRRIVLGGGVMQTEGLLAKIRRKVQAGLNGYLQHPNILDEIDRYIMPPGLRNLSGSLGAIALAQLAEGH
jgi:fructokinase